MIKGSCDQAGFNITDLPDPDLFTTLTTRGTWDAALVRLVRFGSGGLR